MAYVVTTQVRITAEVRDLAGALTNTALVCTVEDPAGVETTPTVANDSTGVYHVDLTLNQAGRWKVEFQGSVTVIVAGDTAITARLSKVDAA